MSKGHLEALAALRSHRAAPVIWGKPKVIVATTAPLPRSVTHCATCTCGKPPAKTPAMKQKAYRDRKKAKA